MLDFGILGNNARNLHYIKKWNPKKSIRLADNKLQTKKFLGERGIPFAETYGVIKNRSQLSDFDFSQLPNTSFVMKPNHGSKGRGIDILKYKGKEVVTKEKIPSKFSSFFRKAKVESYQEEEHLFVLQGQDISESDIKRRALDILDGKFSMTMTDSVIVEEKLIPGEGFKGFCEHGLADLRVIVFNLVPVTAMIRIPTEFSEGKANIAAGGIGCGIDIGTGKITSMFYENKIYTKKFPSSFSHYQGMQIPFWEDILLLSSKVQYFVNLGYLALDWVITGAGPKLLEINARAGLEVQKVADIRLKNVLHKIADLKIQDPEKGVEIAKTLLSKGASNPYRNNKILYLSQRGLVKLATADTQENHDLIIEVDLNKKKNYLSKNIIERISQFNPDSLLFELSDTDIRWKHLSYQPLAQQEDKLIIGQKTASKYLLKPIKKDFELINIINPQKVISVELPELHIIDSKIDRFSRRYNLTAKLRPINYLDELDTFISLRGNYNPVFEYKFPALDLQIKWKEELLKLQEDLQSSYLKSPLLQLFKDKAEELLIRADLLLAYTHQDFKAIEAGNIALFGAVDEELFALSKEKIFATIEKRKEKVGPYLSFPQIREYIEQYLSKMGIYGVEIIENVSTFSRMSISMGKQAKINVSKNVKLTQDDLNILLAHEVDIHLQRFLNGQRTGWNIFRSGTAFYLKDEEGLAVWNAQQVNPEENLSIYKKYFLLGESNKYSFAKLADLIYFFYPQGTLERVFKTGLRMKKGLIHSSQVTGSYVWMKDKVYLDGYTYIKKSVEKDGFNNKLLKGKMKWKDTEYIT